MVDLFGVTPIAKVRANGTLGVYGALWGRKDAPRRFAAYVAKRLPRGKRWRVMVGHCDSAADGAALLAALRERIDCAESWFVEAGPAIGAHAGPQALVAALQET
jgi:fatty acid-binding protein DegV